MAKESKSLSLQSKTIESIEGAKCLNPLFDFSYKVDMVLSDWIALLNFTRIELLNRFSIEEVNLMLDATSGLVMTQQISPILMLHGNIADHITLYKSDNQYGVNKNELLDKLLNLTAHQAYVTLMLCQEYWNAEDPAKVDIENLFMIRQ